MGIELNGREVAKKAELEFISRVEKVKNKLGFTPKLATILVGNDMASVTYVNMKGKACERVGLESVKIHLSEDTTTEQLLTKIDKLNQDREVMGILLQHPVPKGIDERKCFDRISLAKDVDGVSSVSFGQMTMGLDAYVSATPLGIMRLIREYNIDIAGKHAVVIGRSAILGKPVAMLLLQENCTVTICHSRTKNIEEIIRKADIIVGAVGKPKFVKSEWIKDGAILIDAGYNEGNVGDIDVDGAKDRSSYYTPVPGGVGPMTINSLILQTIISAEKFADNM